MPSHEPVHFDSYPAQTKAKHQILRGYLPAYLQPLKGQVARFHYVDGFAGRGTYAGTHPGSPLPALEAIDRAGVAARTSVSLVEESQVFCDDLVRRVRPHEVAHRLFDEPLIRRGTFAEHLGEILARAVYERAVVATFAFVDPCGVDGVLMSDLVRILGLKYGEVLLFFNYDGVNRLLGGVAAGTTAPAPLEGLFGSKESVAGLQEALASRGDREATIFSHFVRALRGATSARFYVPFRIEARSQDRTSHYLLHCSGHPLPFRMMKDVMESVGTPDGSAYGKLEMLADYKRAQLELFRPDISAHKEKILIRLRQEPCRVQELTVDWTSRPEDLFGQRTYRRMLLELEEEGRLAVFDKSNTTPAPASERLRMGRATLGDACWLRLP